MFVNHGDYSFFERGCLVDTEHSGTEFPMFLCRPYPDEDDLYQFGMVIVDITDSWIDKAAVMSYIGMTEESFDPVQYAIGCTEYYSWDNFGANEFSVFNDWRRVCREEICDILKIYMIASDNLNIEW